LSLLTRIDAVSVAGFTGFVLALTGINICRSIIDGAKFGLSVMRISWP
jgi:hypothetical protein